jgi:hypothetical protein
MLLFCKSFRLPQIVSRTASGENGQNDAGLCEGGA